MITITTYDISTAIAGLATDVTPIGCSKITNFELILNVVFLKLFFIIHNTCIYHAMILLMYFLVTYKFYWSIFRYRCINGIEWTLNYLKILLYQKLSIINACIIITIQARQSITISHATTGMYIDIFFKIFKTYLVSFCI